MKLLSSPHSISNSTSSSASFDPHTLCASQRATPSCLAGILHRILCSRSLPTSDRITLTEDTDTSSSHPTVAASPGVVARLMGLDSVSPPRHNIREHLRVSSKLSLLEMPAYFELENEDFFVLTFDTRKRSSIGKNRRRRRRRKRRAKINGNADEKVQLRRKGDQEMEKDHEEHDQDSMKLTRTKKIADQEDCSSQDLSPVSVLDFDQFLFDPSDDCTIRRKLSSRLKDYSPLSTQTEDNSSGDDHNSEVNEETCQRSRRNYSHFQEHFNRESEISRLVEDQVVRRNWKFNDVEDISADFGLGILDQMLEELVDHLYSRS